MLLLIHENKTCLFYFSFYLFGTRFVLLFFHSFFFSFYNVLLLISCNGIIYVHVAGRCCRKIACPFCKFQFNCRYLICQFYNHAMVAAAAASSFFPVPSPSGDAKASKFGSVSASLGGIKTKSASSGALQVNTNAQAPPKINGPPVGLTASVETLKNEDVVSSPAPRTFINQLPDWSMLLAAITTMFLAAEKQWMMLDWKPKRPDMLIDPFGIGRIVQDGLVFRQNFSIRSYEIGADRTASIETLMNHLQVWSCI